MTRMQRARFRELVADALDDVPEPFRRHLETVEVVVEDEPSAEVLREMGLDPGRDTLFGLYEGTPLGARGLADGPLLPDRITIFYRPLVHACRTPAALRREIRATVIHELGHLFGLEDDALEAEGY
jgi:predicted Zn-dependent protease with MMP-like domain